VRLRSFPQFTVSRFLSHLAARSSVVRFATEVPLGRVAQRHRKCLGLVECLVVLQTVVELAEKFVEQVAGGGGVAVAVFSPLAVVLPGRLTVGGGRERPHPADVGEPVVLDMPVRDRQGST
jgi:hypothetical protein